MLGAWPMAHSGVYRILPGLLAVLLASLLVSCAASQDPEADVPPLGEFKLGFAVVFADNATRVPASREADIDDVEATLKSSLTKHFGKFKGRKFYHIAVTVSAYNLSAPGIPLIASPASTLGIEVIIWDDATQKILNEPPKTLIVREPVSAASVIGSGLMQTGDQQLQSLGRQVALDIETWLRSDESPISGL